MKKVFVVLALLLLVTATLPVGTADAYISVSGYYAQWAKFGIDYKGALMYTGPTATVNPGGTTNGDSLTGTTANQTPLYLDWTGYYSRLLAHRTYRAPAPQPNNSETTSPPGDTTGTTPASPPLQNDPGDVGSLSASEKEMLDLTNQERIKAGLPPFSVDARLVRLARMKSQDMYENNYFDHVSPTYGSPYDMERNAGITARVMGAENIARAATVARAHELFMNSEHHRANILDPRHDTIGIGVVTTPYGVYVTQLFIGN